MHWRLKSAAFRLMDAVPFGAQLHFMTQRYVTRTLPRAPETIASIVKKAARFVALYRENGGKPDAPWLEIGAGRDLALAMSVRALTSARVTATDIERLARLDLVRHTAACVSVASGTSVPFLPTWADLSGYGVDYIAPAGLKNIGGKFGCFFSSEVLEHIPADDLEQIMKEARRLLVPGGIMIHSIDYTDHYARSDRSSSRFNFLQFEDCEWEKHNSRFQYVNRLRHSDYVSLFERNGFSVLSAEIRRGDLDVMPSRRFAKLSAADLNIMSSVIVATG